MSVRTSREAVSPTLNNAIGKQRGISGVTIAVVLAAVGAIALTILQVVTTAPASAAQAGIPGLIG